MVHAVLLAVLAPTGSAGRMAPAMPAVVAPATRSTNPGTGAVPPPRITPVDQPDAATRHTNPGTGAVPPPRITPVDQPDAATRHTNPGTGAGPPPRIVPVGNPPA
ncbi:MAG: hypothetical protein JO113_09320 [Candidatus Eremiobacteraeota bacterium]|nr:hypothetical protein [Candidatus Eremiobacteraeota bacterium]